MEAQKKREKVYLITTKEISASFFEHYKFVSQGDKLIADEAFWRFLTKKGCLFSAVWNKVRQSDKNTEAITAFKDIMQETRYDGTQEEALTYFDVVNVTQDLNETTIHGRDKYNIFINALVDCFTDNEKERSICEKLIGDMQQVEGTNIFITHNWYGSSKIGLEVPNTYADELKYEFIELLINHLEKKFNKDIDLHLIVHDKDLLDRGQTDSILKLSDLPNIRAYVNLHDLVNNEKVYVFQHTVQNEFYPEILNAKYKQSTENLVKAIDRFFNYRIPPTIINHDNYIEINILQESPSENRCCTTHEIIDAIAEFQSEGSFFLKRILKYNEYEDIVKQMDNNKPVIVKGTKTLSELNDKRAFFLDSSIWLRYTTVANKICDIPDKYQNLYTTANAQETREFKARLCKNSYLQNFDGGHYKNVTPFPFHSETEMKQKATNVIVKLKKCIHNNVIPKWRLLLVDDNAFNSDANATTKVQKCKVITDILKNDFCIVCVNEDKNVVKVCPNRKEQCTTCASSNFNATIYIDCVRSIQDAHKKLKDRRYDVVLLDYLLGGENDREYGTQLLIELKKQYEDQIHNKAELSEEDLKTLKQYIKVKGPFGKFWIFFVSAFSNAIGENMLSEGMHYNTDYWYIARGACPTTTPELFRYNLYSLFYQQIKDITNVSTIKADDDDSKVDSSVITLIDLLNYIFAQATSVRDRASKNFNSLLHLRAHYDILKLDFYMGNAEKNGSPLVQALFPDIKYYSNAFWEHTQHLIYLIAFGNIRQWNEMWDEYIFVKDILRKAVNEMECKPENQDNLVRKIERYIIEIKNTNHR